LLEEVARGGMGVVYRARHVQLDRIVALKMILTGPLASPAEVARFCHEARTAARLRHPHIVTIHDVGEEEGQHFFTMDFIDGRSLADLVREQPLPPERAIRYTRLVAEAVQHAHNKGVLHRDLKPSNVLIDQADQPHVTDFGLAKNTERDPGLTESGVILGTPSYMPPEQASSDRGQVGPATDVYSLGAILYELVAGRPPFRAASGLETVLQVLHEDPAPPRLLNRALSRDLETVILKCLRKQPAQRYASARHLVADLTALEQGKPIQARRPGPGERLLRWLTHYHPQLIRTMAIVGLVLFFLAGIWWLGEQRRRRQLGSVSWTTDGPPLTAEVMPEDSGELVVPRLTVPTQQPLELPEGNYRVRFSAPHRLSETFLLRIDRETTVQQRIDLSDRLHWEPLGVSLQVDFLPHPRGYHILTVNAQGVRCNDGATGDPVWNARPVRGQTPIDPHWPAGVAEKARGLFSQFFHLRTLPTPGGLFQSGAPHYVPDPIDLDGDGVPDPVWISGDSASALALSGRTGRPLWFSPLLEQEAVGGIPQGRVIGPALWFRPRGQPGEEQILAPLRVRSSMRLGGVPGRTDALALVAWKARTGQILWRSYLGDGKAHLAGPWLTTRERRPVVVVLIGHSVCTVDAASGQLVREYPLDLRSEDETYLEVGGASLSDLDGDGIPELLIRDQSGRELRAFDLGSGQPRWRAPIDLPAEGPASPDWPLVADLEGKGRPKVLRPTPDGGVVILEGSSGQERLRIPGVTQRYRATPSRILVGPDLDGDGVRDLFLACTAWDQNAGEPLLVVQARSGVDGSLIWSRRTPLEHPASLQDRAFSAAPFLWHRGRDGWPLLVVPGPDSVILESSTGRLVHLARGLSNWLPPVDLDGDGLPELVAHQPNAGRRARASATLFAFRAALPRAWARLDEPRPLPPDPAGAGTAGLLTPGPSLLAAADGRILWKTPLAPCQVSPRSPDLTSGTVVQTAEGPALVAFPQVPQQSGLSQVAALSVQTGRPVWTAGLHESIKPSPVIDKILFVRRLTSSTSSGQRIGTGPTSSKAEIRAARARERARNEDPVVVIGYRVEVEDWLVCLSEKTGVVRWRTSRAEGADGSVLADQLASWAGDLNGDGYPDLVVVEQMHGEAPEQIQAFDGATGAPLWRKRTGPLRVHAEGPDLILADLEGNGICKILIQEAGQRQVRALAGADGRDVWRWPPGDRPRPAELNTPLVPVRRGATTAVAVSWSESGVTRTVILGSGGTVLARAAWKSLFMDPTPVVSCDPEGKGVWCLVGRTRVDSTRFEARDPDFNGVRWVSRPFPLKTEVHSILPGAEGRPDTLVIQYPSNGDNVHLEGLEAGTGTIRWRFQGPGPVAGIVSQGEQPPLILTVPGQGTVCTPAQPTTGEGEWDWPPRGETAEVVPEAPEYRLLPWARATTPLGVRAQLLGGLFPLLLLGLALFKGWRLPLTGLVGYGIVVVVVGVWLLVDEGRVHPLGPNEHYRFERWYGLGLFPTPQLLSLVLLVMLGFRGASGLWLRWRNRHPVNRFRPPGSKSALDTTPNLSRPASSG
jgi:outer membrane protein assembly factor BamB